jgi:hypothetical protein
MNLTLTLNAEQSATLGMLVDDYNTSRSSNLTTEQYLETVACNV